MDIKDIYLITPLENYEYARIPIKKIPQEIINQYDLIHITCDKHMMI